MSIINLDINTEAQQRFNALFSSYESALNGQKDRPMHRIRKKAIDNLKEIPFPTLRHEDWKYTSLARILQQKYDLPKDIQPTTASIDNFLYHNEDTYLLVFENGIYSSINSRIGDLQDGLSIMTLNDAMEHEQFSELIETSFSGLIERSENPFVHLNAAFSGAGIFVHIKKGVQVKKPIHILHLATGEETPVLSTSLQIFFAEKSSEVTILESYHSDSGLSAGESVLQVSNCLFELKDQAKVSHFKLQSLADHHFLVHHGWANQHRDSTFTSFTSDLGGRIVRNNMTATHLGENVTSNLYGVFIGRNDQHIDNQTLIDHAVPHCQSNEWYKGILSDKSRGVFNGKVLVRQDAQKTNAFQQNNALILSDQARMDTKPQLEIFADDVKCSHGATIGQMDESAVFYLRSRGLTEFDARTLLQLAFIQEVTGFIEHEGVKIHMEKWINDTFLSQIN